MGTVIVFDVKKKKERVKPPLVYALRKIITELSEENRQLKKKLREMEDANFRKKWGFCD
jgi:hypothetical protein